MQANKWEFKHTNVEGCAITVSFEASSWITALEKFQALLRAAGFALEHDSIAVNAVNHFVDPDIGVAAYYPEPDVVDGLNGFDDPEPSEQPEQTEAKNLGATADNNGWIDWDGLDKGNSPVDGNTLVELKLRNGTQCYDLAGNWLWYQYGHNEDIVKYRIPRTTN